MGFLDSLINGIEIAKDVFDELAKDKPSNISTWIDAMQETGAAEVVLKRKKEDGVYTVKAKAYDADGNCIERETWHIECANKGFKALMEGEKSGLEDLFEGENEVNFDLTADEDDFDEDEDDDFDEDDFDEDDDDE
ncbi:hypothetical protein FACS1894110_24030 [Spirochaetia bacterium]|nr:hypothetical protein FACS1894110_24030 [Spirochaetia bacterium]